MQRQSLRTASQPVTAAALADQLEVTVRTIYRDIAALQASRVPIDGAPGLGYSERCHVVRESGQNRVLRHDRRCS